MNGSRNEVPRKKKLDPIPIGLALIALIMAGLAWRQGGVTQAWQGAMNGGKLILHEFWLLAAAFLCAGLIQALVKQDMITRWLGSESGCRGILLACLGGALIPGGPYVYYPIAAALLKTGAGLGVLVAFVSAKNLWSLSRLPMEVALLGPELTWSRFLVTLIIPPLLGFITELIFGRHLAHIRSKAP